MADEISPARQAIRDRVEELRVRRAEAQKVMDHIELDRKHIQVDCPHPKSHNYTVMGDSTSKCADCGFVFY
jgi:hypothetical protein